MASVSFILSNYEKKNGLSAVQIVVTFASKRFRAITGVEVKAKHWDARRGAVKSSCDMAGMHNTILDELKLRAKGAFTDLVRAGNFEPSLDEFAAAYHARIRGAKYSTDFDGLYAEYRLARTATINTNTQKHDDATIRLFKEFLATIKVKPSLAVFTERNYSAFLSFCHKRGLINNSIGAHIKRLKTFCHWCERNGHDVHKGLATWHKPTDTVSIVALSTQELAMIEQVDLSARPALERTRTLFLISCYSGLRWSDASQITAGDVGEDVLTIHVKKTHDVITIPLHTRLRELVSEHVRQGQRISAQKFNDNIKDLCKLAGIDSPVQRVRHRGATRVVTDCPKWQLVSSHTGRRTFVTLSLQKGMRPEALMRITGHKDIQTLMGYVNMLNKQAHKELLAVWDV